MKKKISIVLVIIACLGLSACSERNMNSIDSNYASNEDTSISQPTTRLPEESESNSLDISGEEGSLEPSDSKEPSAPSDSKEPSAQDDLIEKSSSTNSAPGYSEKDLGLFSLWLPEDSVIESNIIYEDDSELPRKIAEITSIDTISDTASPFEIYDQRYSDAENVSECHFGIYAGKSYSLQKEISEGGMTGFQNTIVYCIESENNIIVITFFPQRGVGIHEQREEFKKILNSIQF